jgi:hypothetical protein
MGKLNHTPSMKTDRFEVCKHARFRRRHHFHL